MEQAINGSNHVIMKTNNRPWFSNIWMLLLVLIAASFMTACGPPRVDPIEEIASNETAFVIPLEGDTASQKGFDSVDYLRRQQVATKRIVVPQRERSTGRMPWSYEWIPTVKVLRVDRSPETREWNEKSAEAGRAGPIAVESKDSIGFGVGINITAHIEVNDTPTYLYYYRGKDLSAIIDKNVRGFLQSELSREFGDIPLELCKANKNVVMERVTQSTVDHFQEYGITISSLGIAEGLTYDDKEIQDAMNRAYVAEMLIQEERQKALAQEETNKRLVALARGEREAAEEFAKAAEAKKKLVELTVAEEVARKWDGRLPTTLIMGEQGEQKHGQVSFFKMLESRPAASASLERDDSTAYAKEQDDAEGEDDQAGHLASRG